MIETHPGPSAHRRAKRVAAFAVTAVALALLALLATPLRAQGSTAAAATSAAPAPTYLQLEAPLTAAVAADLRAQGVRLLHHYGRGVYLASAKPVGYPALSPAQVTRFRAATQDARAATQSLQRFAGSADGSEDARASVDLTLAYPGAAGSLAQVFAQTGFRADAEQMLGGTLWRGTVPASALPTLLAHPLVLGANPTLAEDQPLNLEGRIVAGVTPLNSAVAGAPDLNGAGIVIGIGDGGRLSGHPDIGDRVLRSTSYYNAGWGTHPDMVSGIIAGAGAIDPQRRGVACEAELLVEASSSIVYYAPRYLDEYGMTLTNNSYGPTFNCTNAGRYYSTAASVDQQLHDYPGLLHVYAAGNSGRTVCEERPAGYGTLPAGGMTAKNGLTVGNVDFDRVRFATSSAGPTADGRLKPEVVAVGMSVISNDRHAGYGAGSGTSYAAPSVVGTLALLAQRYQQLHPGQTPDGALLKALACNTAEDLGLAGPDYRHGFGLINGTRAVAALEGGQYLADSLLPAAQTTFPLEVPAGRERAKVMLYWSDPRGDVSGGPALVNDFDLAVVTPAGDTLRPWVLDPAAPGQLAVRGRDTLNNAEQVTWDAPAPGRYTLVVSGRDLPLGTAAFVLTWALPAPQVLVTAPAAGEALVPGQPAYIAWQASPGQRGPWTVAYAVDEEGTGGLQPAWTTIAQGLDSSRRSLRWTPPHTPARTLRIRVSSEGTGMSDELDAPAALLAVPTALRVEALCDGNARLRWAPVDAARAYRVFRYDGSGMVPVADLADTTALLADFGTDTLQYFSVAALGASGQTGRRAYAVTYAVRRGDAGCEQPAAVAFDAVRAKGVNSVQLDWTTHTEYAGLRFVVERGVPGGAWTDWEAVGEREATGSLRAGASYTFTDRKTGPHPTLLYRVRHVAADGSTILSPVVELARYIGGPIAGDVRTVPQAPSDQGPGTDPADDQAPADDQTPGGTRAPCESCGPEVDQEPSVLLGPQLSVTDDGLGGDATQPRWADLFDLQGRWQQRVAVGPGGTRVEWPGHLPKGVYLLRLQGAGQVHTVRVLRP